MTTPTTFEVIDRTLFTMSFQTDVKWVECYLHENTLAPRRFALVERFSKAAHEFELTEFDDLAEATAAYAAAAERTKALIMRALNEMAAPVPPKAQTPASKFASRSMKWNTGRQYSNAGQRIAAYRLDDGRAMFFDLDRGILGITTIKKVLYDEFLSPLRDFVMAAYDDGKYDSSSFDSTKALNQEELNAIEVQLKEAALTA